MPRRKKEESDESEFCLFNRSQKTKSKPKSKYSSGTRKALPKRVMKSVLADTTCSSLNMEPQPILSSITNTAKAQTYESGLSFATDTVNPEVVGNFKKLIVDSVGDTFYDENEYDEHNLDQDPFPVNTDLGGSSTTFDAKPTCSTSIRSAHDSTVEAKCDSSFSLSFLNDITSSEFGLIDTKLEQDNNKLSSIQYTLSESRDFLNDVALSIPENKTIEKPKNVDNQQKTCPICQETLGGSIATVSTICGHIFCLSCMQQVVKTTKNCPTCRNPIKNKSKYVRIYL